MKAGTHSSILSVGGDRFRESVEQDDISLVRRCQKGDAGAFEQLVIKYRSKVFSMICGIVQNEQDAWDLAQEGFIKAWRSIHKFKGESTFYTWLYRIMTNVTLDALRRKDYKNSAEFDDQIASTQIEPNSRTTPAADPLPHWGLEREEIRERIEQAISKLSAEHRAVILMKEIEDLQYNEIAEAMSCSIGTVMSRLFYARKKLQAMLKDVYENL